MEINLFDESMVQSLLDKVCIELKGRVSTIIKAMDDSALQSLSTLFAEAYLQDPYDYKFNEFREKVWKDYGEELKEDMALKLFCERVLSGRMNSWVDKTLWEAIYPHLDEMNPCMIKESIEVRVRVLNRQREYWESLYNQSQGRIDKLESSIESLTLKLSKYEQNISSEPMQDL
jgi:hypothetical protein